MSVTDEIRRRVPASNREALSIPPGASVFEATEAGHPVDAAAYHTRTGEVLIGRAMVHQTLLDRYAPDADLDDHVRADIFARWRRLEMDTMRAAVAVGPTGYPLDWKRAWNNVCDALDAFVALGLPDDWRLVIDGEEVSRCV